MTGLSHLGRVLVLAPHPDDEILGCGGVMARLRDEGAEVFVAAITVGQEPFYSPEATKRVAAELREALTVVGVNELRFLGLPAAGLDMIPGTTINHHIDVLMAEFRPDTVFVPFLGDVHADHQITFLATMVASRPRLPAAPRRIYAYETLSETNWYAPPITPAFVPNVFIDITTTIDRKIEALQCFLSQMRPFPDERSIEAARALATVRGATAHCNAAEAFMLVREIS
jgi:LmbE family N-acetylglucosaminyl deacetylase